MADHLDAPGLTPPGGDLKKDITDVFAFHPPGSVLHGPEDPSSIVLAMNVNPLLEPGDTGFFSSEADYLLFVDTDGDSEEDITFEFEFEEPEGGVQSVEVSTDGTNMEGEGMTGLPGFSLEGGGMAFAGLRDDPFFFDLVGFLGGTLTFTSGADFFKGKNISAIVVEVPTPALTAESPVIGVWGGTEGSGQIDRMGRPVINTVLIPTARKDTFNEAEPDDDVEDFRADVMGTVSALVSAGLSAADPAFVADFLLPDVLTWDTGAATGFPNGRKLDDDVIDVALDLVTGSVITTDLVSANDVPFRSDFPYLADPHT